MTRLIAVLLIVASFCCGCASSNGKSTLWTAVSVTEPLVRSGRLSSLQVDFAMGNDSDMPIDPKVGSWKLNINGTDHPDSQFTFLNGPRDNRWRSLPAGDHLLFSYAMSDWFKKPGTYKIIWKGERFESKPVFFRVLPQNE